MQFAWLVVLFLFSFITGFGLITILQPVQPTLVQKEIFPSPSPYVFAPPTQSLIAHLTVSKGNAQHMPRNTKEYTDASASATLFTDESVKISKESVASISIPTISTLSLTQEAEITLANLYKENFVLLQKNGNVSYSVETIPVSVRVGHLLVEISPNAISSIHIKNNTSVLISTRTGGITVAYVDNRNETHILRLNEGQEAVADLESRAISVR